MGEKVCGGSSVLYYNMSDIFHLMEMPEDEKACLAKAREYDITAYCPSRYGEYIFLKRYCGCSGKEEYLLGNMQIKYKNFKEAYGFWLEAESLGFMHSTLYRNIAWYLINIESDYDKALPYLEKAKECGDNNIDVLLYLNSTYKKLNIEDQERKRALLGWAKGFRHSFAKRCIVDICCQLGEYDEAAGVLLGNTFDIWEHETDEDLRMSNIYRRTFFGLLENSLAENNNVKTESCINYLLHYPDCVNIWFRDQCDAEEVKNKIRELLCRYGYDHEFL
jgi:tetratricopeptide (TPR) repeat protein